MPELEHPINVQTEVTEDCNHRCFYCYNSGRSEFEDSKKMSVENAKEIGQKIVEDVKPFNATITGGEPMLNMPAFLTLLEIFKRNGLNPGVNTNLTLADRNRLEQIRQINPKTRFLVSVPSIDPVVFQEITGKQNLGKVLQNLETLVSLGFGSSVNIVTNRLNVDSVYQAGKFLNQHYGIQSISTTPALKPSLADCDSSKFLGVEGILHGTQQLLKLREDLGMKISVLTVLPYCMIPEEWRKINIFRRGCSAGRTSIQVGYDGEIRSCGHSPFSEGNLLEEPFSKIWEKMEPYGADKYIPKECGDCSEVEYCKGGCRFEGLGETEKLDRPDPRMRSILKTHFSPTLESLDPDKLYEFNPFKTRQEGPGVYTLYNGQVFTTTKATKKFIDEIKGIGFRLNSFPDKLRPVAHSIGQKLKHKGFLK
ncbi:MAG: radical SAM protein [Nanoarchaeota archaeon]|nr:radical SAM protein [Nanoarchaeota archaeon]